MILNKIQLYLLMQKTWDTFVLVIQKHPHVSVFASWHEAISNLELLSV